MIRLPGELREEIEMMRAEIQPLVANLLLRLKPEVMKYLCDDAVGKVF